MLSHTHPSPKLPWWAWRRRAARARFLERVAATEFRISLDGVPQIAQSFEAAYLAAQYAGSRDVVAGVAFTDLMKFGNRITDQELTVGLRLPMDVSLL